MEPKDNLDKALILKVCLAKVHMDHKDCLVRNMALKGFQAKELTARKVYLGKAATAHKEFNSPQTLMELGELKKVLPQVQPKAPQAPQAYKVEMIKIGTSKLPQTLT